MPSIRDENLQFRLQSYNGYAIPSRVPFKTKNTRAPACVFQNQRQPVNDKQTRPFLLIFLDIKCDLGYKNNCTVSVTTHRSLEFCKQFFLFRWFSFHWSLCREKKFPGATTYKKLQHLCVWLTWLNFFCKMSHQIKNIIA